MTSRRHDFVSCALLALVGCGTPNGGVRPDETSAEGHRSEAERERAAAAQHAALYDPGATRLDPALANSANSVPEQAFTNPTDAHLREADRHRAHARAHDRAAQALERFEAAECKDVPPRERAACPLLGPVTAINDLRDGVRVDLAATASASAVVAAMRCHYAFARARGFSEDAAACPLYIRGIVIERSGDGRGVQITADRPELAGEIQRRVRIEAMHAPQSRQP
jgi:hypothetical protein